MGSHFFSAPSFWSLRLTACHPAGRFAFYAANPAHTKGFATRASSPCPVGGPPRPLSVRPRNPPPGPPERPRERRNSPVLSVPPAARVSGHRRMGAALLPRKANTLCRFRQTARPPSAVNPRRDGRDRTVNLRCSATRRGLCRFPSRGCRNRIFSLGLHRHIADAILHFIHHRKADATST